LIRQKPGRKGGRACFDQRLDPTFSWLRHSDARQVFDLPLSANQMAVYDLDGSQTLAENKGSQRQVQDLPRISVAEPSDQAVAG